MKRHFEITEPLTIGTAYFVAKSDAILMFEKQQQAKTNEHCHNSDCQKVNSLLP